MKDFWKSVLIGLVTLAVIVGGVSAWFSYVPEKVTLWLEMAVCVFCILSLIIALSAIAGIAVTCLITELRKRCRKDEN